VKSVSKGSKSGSALSLDADFTMSNPQYKGGTSAELTVTFNAEGKKE
jgi:hypothetical protein